MLFRSEVMKIVFPLDAESGAAIDLTLTSTQVLRPNNLGSVGVDGVVAHPLMISKAIMPIEMKEGSVTLNLFIVHPFVASKYASFKKL